MPEFQEIPNHPGLQYQEGPKGPPANRLGQQLTEITPRQDLGHIERHYQEQALGSQFLPNEGFSNAGELAKLLEEVASDLIPPDQYDRRHIFTVAFPHVVGRSGVVEVQPDDIVARITRDEGAPGEAEVNTVVRPEKPATNLVTCEFGVIWPKQGSRGETVKFGLLAAFPGEPAPRLTTKARTERYKADPGKDPTFETDAAFWAKHAFVTTPA